MGLIGYILLHFNYINCIVYRTGQKSLERFLKEVSSTHQACIYLIKNTGKKKQ